MEERFYLLAPALILLVILLSSFLVYCGMCAIGKPPDMGRVKHNQFFGLFMARFLVWVIQPVERLLISTKVSPNTITAVSLVMCAACGVAVGLGQLGGAVWLYTVAGILDIVDGRIARLQNRSSNSGALFDSVSDRWGELFTFTGYAWYLRDSIWLLAVMGAMGSSMMVSYTRARAEGLKIELSGGLMQRAERIFVVVVGTMLAAWFSLAPETPDAHDNGVMILGGTMLLCAIASSATAINRWIMAYKALSKRDASPAAQAKDAPKLVEEPRPAAERPAPEIFVAPVPKALRESAELPL